MINTLTSLSTGLRSSPILALLVIVFAGCDAEASRDYGTVIEDSRWEWVAAAGSGDWTEAADLAALPGGDVVAVGFGREGVRFDRTTVQVPSELGGLVARYGADGELVWAQSIGDEGRFGLESVAAAPSGIIFVAGSLTPGIRIPRAASAVLAGSTLYRDHSWTDGALEEGDAFIAALDSETGGPLWAFQMNADLMSKVSSLTLAADGGFYVAGHFTGTLTDGGPSVHGEPSIFLSRYSAEGKRLWTQVGEHTGVEGKASVIEAADGSVYLSGSFSGRARFAETNIEAEAQNEMFVARFTDSGELLWIRTGATKGAGPVADLEELPARGYYRGSSRAYAIAARPDGGVVVGGAFRGKIAFGDSTVAATPSEGREIFDDGFVAALDEDGRELWIATGGGPKGDSVQGVAVDESGNVYATGSFMGEAWFGPHRLFAETGEVFSPRLIFVTKFDPNGEPIWAVQSVASGGYSAGNAVTVTPDGQCFAAGVFTGEARFGTHHMRGMRSRSMFVAGLDCKD